MSKIVHHHIYNPKVPNPFYKGTQNDRACSTVVTCSLEGTCPLLAKGECAARGVFASCVYGQQRQQEGLTPRAGGFYKWIQDQNAKYAGVKILNAATRKATLIGDHVWLPYTWMKEALGCRSEFLPVSEFTPALIVKLCEYCPRDMFGVLIREYQRDVAPKIVSHLSEDFPKALGEAAKISPLIQKVLASLTKVGRKALLRTVLPNVGVFEKGWKWDGEFLSIEDETQAHAATLFTLVRGAEIHIRPVADAVVVITDNGQVGPDTIFVD